MMHGNYPRPEPGNVYPRPPAPAPAVQEAAAITINEHAHGDDHHAAPEPKVAVAVTPPSGPPRRLLSTLTSEQHKEYPITTGVMDYFPDALALIANVSYKGNQKHNPGQPLHWARGKSMDHEDCLARHTIERDAVDDDTLHAANRAWRALAALQELAEKRYNLDPPRGATIPPR